MVSRGRVFACQILMDLSLLSVSRFSIELRDVNFRLRVVLLRDGPALMPFIEPVLTAVVSAARMKVCPCGGFDRMARGILRRPVISFGGVLRFNVFILSGLMLFICGV
jgi:hypothetical protein